MAEGFSVIPDISMGLFGIIDVRNVALAHIRPMQNPEVNGRRYLLCGKTLWRKEGIDILEEK